MGKKLIIFVVLLTLVGCSTTKKANDLYSHSVIQEDIMKTKSTNVVDYKHYIDSLFSISTFTFDIYDTEHPDTMGNYPVKMHGESVTKTTNVDIREETATETHIERDTINYNADNTIVEHNEKETTTRNKTLDIICLFVFGSFFIMFYKLNKED